jgi:hypothetical protein
MDLTGYQRLMNSTKWDEIWQAMSDFPEMNLWRTKILKQVIQVFGMGNGFIIGQDS